MIGTAIHFNQLICQQMLLGEMLPVANRQEKRRYLAISSKRSLIWVEERTKKATYI